MRTLAVLAASVFPMVLLAQTSGPPQTTVAAIPANGAVVTTPPAVTEPLDYVCPMDPDQRSDKPGTCKRCGMKMVLGVPDQVEFPVELTTTPGVIQPGQKTQLKFAVHDPKTGAVVKHFEIVHEKLFHMFIVSSDLSYFLHDHPVPQPDGTFIFPNAVFPKAGMYRVVADIYPTGGTPQLVAETVFAEGKPGEAPNLSDASLQPDVGLQHGANTDVELEMVPPHPISGSKTLLFFRMKPADDLQKWLGAWAHMLIASDDTIDLIHEHPFIADGGPQMQFNVIFPRAKTYRIFLQFQRKGVVNTVSFNVPVVDLEHVPE